MDLLRFPRGKHCRKRDFVTLALSKIPVLTLVSLAIVVGPFNDGFEDVLKLTAPILIIFASAGIVIGLVVGVVHHGASNTIHLLALKAQGSDHYHNEMSYDKSLTEMGHVTNDFMQGVIRNSLTIVPRWETLNFFVLGLSYHVEHHLFPSVPYWLLPRVNLLVTQYCKEKNIKMNNNLSYADGYRLYFESLRQLGKLPEAQKSQESIVAPQISASHEQKSISHEAEDFVEPDRGGVAVQQAESQGQMGPTNIETVVEM
jgi:fatty acid desaturase